MTKLRLNMKNKVLNEGQDHLSPNQKEYILNTGLLEHWIWV